MNISDDWDCFKNKPRVKDFDNVNSKFNLLLPILNDTAAARKMGLQGSITYTKEHWVLILHVSSAMMCLCIGVVLGSTSSSKG